MQPQVLIWDVAKPRMGICRLRLNEMLHGFLLWLGNEKAVCIFWDTINIYNFARVLQEDDLTQMTNFFSLYSVLNEIIPGSATNFNWPIEVQYISPITLMSSDWTTEKSKRWKEYKGLKETANLGGLNSPTTKPAKMLFIGEKAHWIPWNSGKTAMRGSP